jgi:hypothetical protein
LPEGTRHVDAKADWIMQTVDRLVPLLTRPTQLCIAAQDMVERRGIVTTADLVASRDALLAGLAHVLGPPSEPTLAAWNQACGLFADVISALVVNPFCKGSRPPRRQIRPRMARPKSVPWVGFGHGTPNDICRVARGARPRCDRRGRSSPPVLLREVP